jgi:hypothetical protein
MGTGGAVNRSLAGQRLYGYKSNRCGRGLYRACAQVGAIACAVAPALVDTLVYQASVGVPVSSPRVDLPAE